MQDDDSTSRDGEINWGLEAIVARGNLDELEGLASDDLEGLIRSQRDMVRVCEERAEAQRREWMAAAHREESTRAAQAILPLRQEHDSWTVRRLLEGAERLITLAGLVRRGFAAAPTNAELAPLEAFGVLGTTDPVHVSRGRFMLFVERCGELADHPRLSDLRLDAIACDLPRPLRRRVTRDMVRELGDAWRQGRTGWLVGEPKWARIVAQAQILGIPLPPGDPGKALERAWRRIGTRRDERGTPSGSAW